MSDWLASQRMVLREVAQEFIIRQALAIRLKSEPEQKHLISIVGERANFSDFVKAAAVSYIYHYRGVHTINLASGEGAAPEEQGGIAKKQWDELYEEVDTLLTDSFQKERELLRQQIEIQFEAAEMRLKGKSKDKIQKLIQDKLVKIYTSYPKTHFVDFLGNINYIAPPIRAKKIKLAYGFKPKPIELEEDIKSSHDEECIEISTYKELKQKIEEMVDLESLTSDVENLEYTSSVITENLLQNMPQKDLNLKAYIDVCKLKLELLKLFDDYDTKKTKISDLYGMSRKIITNEVLKHASEPILLESFLMYLLDETREDIEHRMKQQGFDDWYALCSSLTLPVDKLTNKLEEINIGVEDFKYAIERIARLLRIRNTLVKNVIPRLKGQGYKVHEGKISLWTYTKPASELSGIDDIVLRELKKYMMLPPPEELKELLEVEQKVNTILKALNITNIRELMAMSQIEEFVRRVNDDAYYKLISDSFTHLSRVVEIYDRLRKDIERFGIIYKTVLEESEPNLKASKEELFFDLIMLRQKELKEIFPHLTTSQINGLIWARTSSKSLKEAIQELRKSPSPTFLGIVEKPLKIDKIPPESYATAFDITQRYNEIQEEKRKRIDMAKEKEEKKKELARMERFERIEPIGLIEKKVNVAMRAVSGVELAQLEWNETDDRRTAATLLFYLRTETGKNVCPVCANEVENDYCPNHGTITPLSLGNLEALAKFYYLSINTIYSTFKRQEVEKITYDEAVRLIKNMLADLQREGKLSSKITPSTLMEGDVERYLAPAIAEQIGKVYNDVLSYSRRLKR
ncbi:MAG: hypothetical protein ACUVXA_05845 [Candidatus Jordarchaeum sp.]|uniref:hypothetical protein n=1 Tax=Candidatus Jordarchaeum sp. TaxID=2823881 RepID=UPI00404A0268